MTVRDMPVADATARSGPDQTRAYTRVRARIGITRSHRNPRRVIRLIGATIVGDFRRWWLMAARPASTRAWWRTQRAGVGTVPGDSPALRAAWRVDNWTTGLAFRAASVLLHLAAAGVAWLGYHPLRRWTAVLLITGVAIAALTNH